MGGPGADAARSALQQYHSSPLNPVGQQPQSAPAVNPIISPAPLPTGGPQLPVEQTQNFDPSVFKDNILDEVLQTAKQQKFLNSPAVKDAVSSITLRNFFNFTNPNAIPDQRSMFRQVISRLR
jgi:hypothetical protein